MEGATARWYASLTHKSLDRFQTLARRVAGEVPRGSRVLEVAPGPGYFAVELAKIGGYEITGLDISRTFVEIAQRNAAEAGVAIDFRQGNAASMLFRDESFDFLVCSAAFKNFAQPVEALREMYRVLKPGGRALIIDLRRDATRKSIDEAVDQMHAGPIDRVITKLTFRFMLLKRAYTKSEFENLVGQTKFRSCEISEDCIALEVSLRK
ncbi:MAG TPA: class I SAM-dependent methyltransferase [Bryobacteraceae bacterium]|nr:class I SAM-dependent methyltransferase [Bryobacteraceae bacterium]